MVKGRRRVEDDRAGERDGLFADRHQDQEIES
jgi:hypothetical protein